jgi:protocatechuate 3,4-dioxygenase beta subunit
VSLGALLAACTGAEEPVTSASVSTSDGATASIEPQSPSSTDVAALFDDAAACTLTPEQTEGPYYFDVDSIRSDIREDRDGTTLRLAVRVQDAVACTAIRNAVVEIWHCDAEGLYSGFELASMGGGGGRTDEETYLRGAQVTSADGIVEFLTIYPGWCRGRTVHIHAKVHPDGASVLTTQFYFDEDVTSGVYEASPHSDRTDRDTFNEDDMIFDASTMLTLSDGGDGILGLITVGVAG